MDLISKSERFVYVRVAVPRELFEKLVSQAGSVGRALGGLRVSWERLLSTARVERIN